MTTATHDNHGHRITDATQARDFVLAGNAVFTLVSDATGARFTYRVRASRDGAVHFVAFLGGSDNCTDYRYIGFVRNGAFVYGGIKAKAGQGAPCVRAIGWALRHLLAETPDLPDVLEVWHEGRCGRCGRRLTVPESIATGLGPECAGRVGRGSAAA